MNDENKKMNDLIRRAAGLEPDKKRPKEMNDILRQATGREVFVRDEEGRFVRKEPE